MPDIVIHNSMGKQVIEGLKKDVAVIINYDIFRLAVMGPDPFITGSLLDSSATILKKDLQPCIQIVLVFFSSNW